MSRADLAAFTPEALPHWDGAFVERAEVRAEWSMQQAAVVGHASRAGACVSEPGPVSRVAVLFTRADSVYRVLGADCYDMERDARSFDLGCPVVAHPPCRSWSQLSHFAKPRADERDLAWFAVHVVRHCGGVLEHPANSRLWREMGCVGYGMRDAFGGVLVPALQSWWGHRAPKASAFYIVGPVPAMPDDSERLPTTTVERMCRQERERTPPELARWLLDTARLAA